MFLNQTLLRFSNQRRSGTQHSDFQNTFPSVTITHVRFVMLGQQGVGKSSIANSLLGYDNLANLGKKKNRKKVPFAVGHGLRSKTKMTSFRFLSSQIWIWLKKSWKTFTALAISWGRQTVQTSLLLTPQVSRWTSISSQQKSFFNLNIFIFIFFKPKYFHLFPT